MSRSRKIHSQQKDGVDRDGRALGRTAPRGGLNPTPTAAQSALAESTRNALHFGLRHGRRPGLRTVPARARPKTARARCQAHDHAAPRALQRRAGDRGRQGREGRPAERAAAAARAHRRDDGRLRRGRGAAGADDHGRALDPRLGFVCAARAALPPHRAERRRPGALLDEIAEAMPPCASSSTRPRPRRRRARRRRRGRRRSAAGGGAAAGWRHARVWRGAHAAGVGTRPSLSRRCSSRPVRRRRRRVPPRRTSATTTARAAAVAAAHGARRASRRSPTRARATDAADPSACARRPHVGCVGGFADVCRLLLANGATRTARTDGRAPLHLIAGARALEADAAADPAALVAALVKAGARLYVRRARRRRPNRSARPTTTTTTTRAAAAAAAAEALPRAPPAHTPRGAGCRARSRRCSTRRGRARVRGGRRPERAVRARARAARGEAEPDAEAARLLLARAPQRPARRGREGAVGARRGGRGRGGRGGRGGARRPGGVDRAELLELAPSADKPDDHDAAPDAPPPGAAPPPPDAPPPASRPTCCAGASSRSSLPRRRAPPPRREARPRPPSSSSPPRRRRGRAVPRGRAARRLGRRDRRAARARAQAGVGPRRRVRPQARARARSPPAAATTPRVAARLRRVLVGGPARPTCCARAPRARRGGRGRGRRPTGRARRCSTSRRERAPVSPRSRTFRHI